MALDLASINPSLPFPQGDGAFVGQTMQAAAHVVPMVRVQMPKQEPLIPSDLQQTLRDMEKLSQAFNHRLSFSVNQKLDSIVVKVVDSETDKVVREIPPAELQHVYEAIRETIGLLFDSKA
ncbi:MAG TPA: flagellar protein FlaG [Rectinemataceae bacterium]|nr:flagellar protein FlaG [Rectinemataceae bacterium]